MSIDKKIAEKLVALAEKEIEESESLIDVFQTNLKCAEEKIQRYAFVETIGLDFEPIIKRFRKTLKDEKDSKKSFNDKINTEYVRIEELKYFIEEIRGAFTL